MHEYAAVVRRVIDGDTIVADIDLGFRLWMHGERIRLLGIDAPEMTGDTREAGFAAREWLRQRIDGQTVIVRTARGKGREDDSFGRWLAMVYMGGESINDAIVEAGHAVRHTFADVVARAVLEKWQEAIDD